MGFAAFLSDEFERRKRRNPRYSLRAFGRDLDCDHATLSQWLRGTRPLTDEAIAALCAGLGLSGAARARACEFDALDRAVLGATRTAAAPTSPAIAAALGVPVDRVNIALHRLLRLGLLRMEGGAWSPLEQETAA